MLEPVGESAYDFLLPRSIAYRPVLNTERTGPRSLMPLVEVLRDGAETKDAGWHRNAERAARGLPVVENISNHMEPWEKQLVCVMHFGYTCMIWFTHRFKSSGLGRNPLVEWRHASCQLSSLGSRMGP